MTPLAVRALVLLSVAAAVANAQCPAAGLPSLDELPDDTIRVLQPGGSTGCMYGDPFQFVVKKASTSKVHVEFIGGGACWDARCVSLDSSADIEPEFLATDCLPTAFLPPGSLEGVMDPSNEDNPLRDHTLVIVPYCTQDLHWGARNTTYSNGTLERTANHNGRANAMAVMEWVFDNFEAPEDVVVGGCSAGGYASLFYGTLAAEYYGRTSPASTTTVLAESSAGILTPEFVLEDLPNWGIECTLPAYRDSLATIQGYVAEGNGESLTAFIIAAAEAYPSTRFVIHDHFSDFVQIGFFILGGGDGTAFVPKLLRAEALTAPLPNVFRWLSAGTAHCVASFSEPAATDPTFLPWFTDVHARTGSPEDFRDASAPPCIPDFGCSTAPIPEPSTVPEPVCEDTLFDSRSSLSACDAASASATSGSNYLAATLVFE